MHLFESMARDGHEQVMFWSEPEAGYRGIIAVHDTTLGPSMGGTRFWDYGSEAEALEDVLRLSRAMTYKCAISGLEAGGGKSLIIGDPRTGDREPIFQAHGRAIDSLGGRYYAAEDVGTSVEDMEIIRSVTRYVSGLESGLGDPSPLTAYGTFEGIRACAIERYGSPELRGRHVAVQGVGHVGFHLCALLAEAGARLTVTDIDVERVDRAVHAFGAAAVAPEAIYHVSADVLAPCALGSVIDDSTIGHLQVDIVAGAANDQLADDRLGEALLQRGILFAPDFVVNAGGIINVYGELKGWSAEACRTKTAEIHSTVLDVFRRAREEGVTPVTAARRMAELRIAEARHAHR